MKTRNFTRLGLLGLTLFTLSNATNAQKALDLSGNPTNKTYGVAINSNGNPIVPSSVSGSSKSYTISAWVKQPAGTTGDQDIIALGDTTGGDICTISLRITAQGEYRFEEYNGLYGEDLANSSGNTSLWTGQDRIFVSNDIISPTQWTHIVITKNGTTVTMYINGVQEFGTESLTYDQGKNGPSFKVTTYSNVSSATHFGVITEAEVPNILAVGALYHGGIGNYFIGEIDNVAFYDVALTSSEVTDVFNNGIDAVQPANLWAAWKFNDGANPTADFTSNNRKLQIRNVVGSAFVNDEGTLPVQFGAVSVTNVHNAALIQWTTAQEINNNYFEIERSANGKDWNAIAKVNGKGTTSSSSSYSYTDAQPLSGKSFYRIKQYDYDGRTSVSEVSDITLTSTSNATVSLYPNPIVNVLNIKTTESISSFRILSLTGVNYTSQLQTQKLSDTNWTVNVGSLPAGIYVVEINNKSYKVVKK